tara:strand:+ start:1150 stop:1362 length:213 start_codon:yes stop_codon:yes gene_type:complete
VRVEINGLFKQILNGIHDDLYVELSEDWENESTEYYNANWVRNIREAQDVDELKDALIRIVKGLDKYLRD